VHTGREDVAVHRERGSARDAGVVRRLQDHGAQQTHLGFEQAVRVRDLGALESVRADQLREAIGLVRRRAAHAAHLVDDNVVSTLGELPRRFATGESAADDVNFLHHRDIMMMSVYV
jgi:hypothetical protein